MEGTPKVKNKFSLSLSRLSKKRHIASPQSRVPATSSGLSVSPNVLDIPSSPSVLPVYAEKDVHTPPHRKLSLDDSLDYSPKPFDTSLSPTNLLPQTLNIDIPEVGWQWTDETSSATLDSAYTESGSIPSGSSTTVSKRFWGDTQRQTSKLRREEHRKIIELELRRAERLRIDKQLNRRCANLQKLLRENEANGMKKLKQTINRKARKIEQLSELPTNSMAMRLQSSDDIVTKSVTLSTPIFTPNASEKCNGAILNASADSLPAANRNDTLEDFLNDSESDGLLLEATQNLESQIMELTPAPQIYTAASSTVTKNVSESQIPTTLITPTTNTISTSNKKNNASFYMKFLEDDFPEDWLVGLDDVLQDITQLKKSRTSFQRYNSMPAATTCSTKTTSASSTSGTSVTSTETPTSSSTSTTTLAATVRRPTGAAQSNNRNVPTVTPCFSKITRHVSSNSLSRPTSNCRGRQLLIRK